MMASLASLQTTAKNDDAAAKRAESAAATAATASAKASDAAKTARAKADASALAYANALNPPKPVPAAPTRPPPPAPPVSSGPAPVPPPPPPAPPSPQPAPVQTVLAAPDGTKLGALLFEERWDKLDLYTGPGKGRWSTAGWPSEVYGPGWTVVGRDPVTTIDAECVAYINSNYPALASIKPWQLGPGYVDLVADVTPPALSEVCGGMPLTSGMLTTYWTFCAAFGYFEWTNVQMICGPPPIFCPWPALWVVPQSLKAYPAIDINVQTEAMKDLPEGDALEMQDPNLRDGNATFHREIPPGSGVRNWETHALTFPKGDFRQPHTVGLLRTPAFEIVFYDGVEVGRRAMTPEAAVPVYLRMNLGMGTGNSWTRKASGREFDPAQMPLRFRIGPITVRALA